MLVLSEWPQGTDRRPDGWGRFLFPFQLFLLVLQSEIPCRFYIKEREGCLEKWRNFILTKTDLGSNYSPVS